jgi:hypothetical protein
VLERSQINFDIRYISLLLQRLNQMIINTHIHHHHLTHAVSCDGIM